jgi:hypothetical protein
MVTWNATEAPPWVPDVSVALAVKVWVPALRADVVIKKLLLVAMPVPTTVVPSVS